MVTKEVQGTRQTTDALSGAGLLQSKAEWDSRNSQLASSINVMLARNLKRRVGRALDVGCMALGDLSDRYGRGLDLEWFGVDPDIDCPRMSAGGAHLSHGAAHDLNFPSGHFDAVTLANVYEHITPSLREQSLKEIRRILAPGGILVGQVPNPYFPIESHSRLPFLGCLPRSWQRQYWRLTPTGWDFEQAHFFSVTIGQLARLANEVGLETVLTRSFNYGTEAIPSSVRWAAQLHAVLGWPAWSWQFVFRRPD